MANCRELHKLILDAYKSDKIIAALCYTVSTLVFYLRKESQGAPACLGFLRPRHGNGFYNPTDDDKGTDVVTPGFLIPLEDLIGGAVGPNGAGIARINANRESPQVYYDYPFVNVTSVESSIAFGELLVKAVKERGL